MTEEFLPQWKFPRDNSLSKAFKYRHFKQKINIYILKGSPSALCLKCFREEIRRNVLSWLVSCDRLIWNEENLSTYYVRSSRRWRPIVRDKKENVERKGYEVRLKYFLGSVICFQFRKMKKKLRKFSSRQSVGQRIRSPHPLLSHLEKIHPLLSFVQFASRIETDYEYSLQVLKDEKISDEKVLDNQLLRYPFSTSV